MVAEFPSPVGGFSVSASGSTVTEYPAPLFVVTVMVTTAVGVSPGLPVSVNELVSPDSAIADPTVTFAVVTPPEVAARAAVPDKPPAAATPASAVTANKVAHLARIDGNISSDSFPLSRVSP